MRAVLHQDSQHEAPETMIAIFCFCFDTSVVHTWGGALPMYCYLLSEAPLHCQYELHVSLFVRTAHTTLTAYNVSGPTV